MNKYFSLLSKIHIHPIFWVLIAIGAMTAQFKALCILFSIVFIHEMGHAVCASFFSWRIKSIQLLPFGGAVEMEEHGNRPLKEDLFVVISGPIQHLWMQIAAWIFWEANFINDSTYEMFIFFNMSIFLFNLLPIWPLDGGKLLFILLSKQKPFSVAHKEMLRISAVVFSCLFLFLLFFNPTLLSGWIIAAFIVHSIYTEYKQRQFVYIRFLMERYYGNHQAFTVLKPIIVDRDDLIYHVLLKFQRGCKHPIIVEDDGKKLFQLDENELLHSFFSEKKTDRKMGDLQYVY
ncbi:M50 family metallopeptidase [Aeribacillus sp. FSL k6-2211]|uniref:M50 family metallopeptidase n=1 Tax=Aeribacillus sp. FSL k6-2211 TaxID=2954608 RepID=UPI0030CBDFD9